MRKYKKGKGLIVAHSKSYLLGLLINLENEEAVSTDSRIVVSHFHVELPSLVAGLRQEQVTSWLSVLISQLHGPAGHSQGLAMRTGHPIGSLSHMV